MTTGTVMLAFYGDDFTGSTDALEVTALAGLPTVLFTRVPGTEDLRRFAGYPVVGIAGTARSQSPEWMEAHLPARFEALARLSPRIIQYKVCSTFDSSPRTGSIGRAIDIGSRFVPADWSPSIVGAPHLGRWLVFGNLFAATGGTRYRIDRHPTMSRHPVTPMRESDLRLHLKEQTERRILGIDIASLARGEAEAEREKARAERAVTFVDVADDVSQRAAGRLVWEGAGEGIFSASSSGLQYALVAHWRETGILPPEAPAFPPAAAVDRLLVLSGSCSPVTAEQIAGAEAAGFAAIRLDVAAAVDAARQEGEVARIMEAATAAFATGRSVVVFAAKTVDDPAFVALKERAGTDAASFSAAQDAIGRTLGIVAARAVPAFGLQRIVVAGGDTSGRVLESIPVVALEVAHPLGRGAPICRCHGTEAAFDGLQVVLKGGQIGQPSLFVDALEGTARG
ncbi:four-carbon acid sugar kinase family protein [Jiella avicenniae]|uniref:Four-carbon acid sugar kinase family protein n=1 Tax=Jiella avicenniae TaxID=2907202 RepID=A0A9X1T3H9_9HYPH|nr:four-carbon acid sugar kinase family protein [Jiella avicenniae]MCE7026544.1 four-carbon acid sugar kinase family protein [Jiella avicenniae]